MFYWNWLLKMLEFSQEPLNKNRASMLQFLAWGVLSLSQLLYLDMSRRALLLFQEISRDAFAGSLDLMVLKGDGMEVASSNPSWYVIQTISQNFPELFLVVDQILLTVFATIWWQRKLIQFWVSIGALSVIILDICTLIYFPLWNPQCITLEIYRGREELYPLIESSQ